MPALSDKQLALLKAGKHFGVVGTVGDDGRPQTSVVWVNDPRLSITVWDNDDPYKYFEVEGTAELDEEGAGEHINELSLRYEGKPFHTPTDRVIVRVNPTRVLDHGIDD